MMYDEDEGMIRKNIIMHQLFLFLLPFFTFIDEGSKICGYDIVLNGLHDKRTDNKQTHLMAQNEMCL